MITALKSTKAGFTLVELIVVIAILGILAGIAVPVYSGYIAKAGEAADLQLLSAMNTAFTASCAEMNIDPTGILGIAALSGEAGNKTIASVSAVGDVTAEQLTGLNTAFRRYYGENIDKPFRRFTSLGYDPENGVFIDGNKKIPLSLANGTTLTISAGALNNFLVGSFISTDPDKQVESINHLTGSMDTLIAKALSADGATDWMVSDAGFIKFLSDLGLPEALNGEQRANALVLYAAANSDKVATADILNAMSTGGSLGLDSFMETANDTGALIATASTAYAMMYAYANSGANIETTTPGDTIPLYLKSMDGLTTGSTPDQVQTWLDNQISLGNYPSGSTIEPSYNSKGNFIGASITTPATTSTTPASEWFTEQTSQLQNIYSVDDMYQSIRDDAGFRQYIAANGNADMDAFVGALTMINDNVSSSNVQDILEKGWTGGGVGDWLNQAINGG